MLTHAAHFKTALRMTAGVWAVAALCVALRESARGGPVAAPPSILLITIDTLRADHVGCYGYSHVETPTIDALAARGAL